jgi:hypothetical protein
VRCQRRLPPGGVEWVSNLWFWTTNSELVNFPCLHIYCDNFEPFPYFKLNKLQNILWIWSSLWSLKSPQKSIFR